MHSVFKISAGPRTLTGKIWVGPASFPSLSYINFGKIVLRSGKFQILFWRLCISQSCGMPCKQLLIHHKIFTTISQSTHITTINRNYMVKLRPQKTYSQERHSFFIRRNNDSNISVSFVNTFLRILPRILNPLILLVTSEYTGRIAWLLMPWLLAYSANPWDAMLLAMYLG